MAQQEIVITLENIEAIINKVTVELIIENGILSERKRLKQWMQVKEFKRVSFSLNIQLINDLMDFIQENKLGEYEEGTTARNMMEELGKHVGLLHFLYKRGKP